LDFLAASTASVTAALCVRAVGANKVVGLLMPETDCSADSLRLGKMIADWLGIQAIVEDITPMLEAAGCYRRRDEAIRSMIPEYTSEYRSKIVLPSAEDSSPYAVFSAVVQSPSGETKKVRLSLEAYRGIVAATNFKQRVRSMMAYYHADRLNYTYIGTPNLLEYDQGFFVKNGDGAADLKPIAHLYKTQVYQLAEYFQIPEEVSTASAHHGHVFDGTIAGGVYFFRAASRHGPVPMGQEPRRSRSRNRRGAGSDTRTGRTHFQKHRLEACRDSLSSHSTTVVRRRSRVAATVCQPRL
jgi:NH3-dependent NAD+ synthetase